MRRIKSTLDTIGFLLVAIPAVVLAYPIAVLYAGRYLALAYMRYAVPNPEAPNAD